MSFEAEVTGALFCVEEDEDDESLVAEAGVIGITAGTLDLRKNCVTFVNSKITSIIISSTTAIATMAERDFNRW